MTSDERLREEQTTTDERLREEQTTTDARPREETNNVATRVRVSIRYFGAAHAAAGVESETRTVQAGTGVAELTNQLGEQNRRLATVLARCSYLCDGVAVHDTSAPLRTGQTIDVLPPFAGG